jgi:hypothetical protein
MTRTSLYLSTDSGLTLEETLTAANQSTEWLRLSGQLAIQITGTATAVSVQVERSTRDPQTLTPNTAPAGDVITGNPATGMQPKAYAEPGVAWWRAKLTAITGADCTVAINGIGGR